MNAHPKIPVPNAGEISKFLFALFPPNFVHAFPDAWIDITCIRPDKTVAPSFFSAHDLKQAVDHVMKMNTAGWNCYVGAALRQGEKPKDGERSGKKHFCAASHFWVDLDGAGDYERAVDVCKRERVDVAMLNVTGTKPHTRAQIWIKSAKPITSIPELESANVSLRDALNGDKVQNADRIMRIGGTVNLPPRYKTEKGYEVELTTMAANARASTYSAAVLSRLSSAGSNSAGEPSDASDRGKSYPGANCFEQHGDREAGENGRLTDADMDALLTKHADGTGESWHFDLRAVADEMLKRGCDPFTIRRAIAAACKNGIDDRDIGPLIDKRWLAFTEERIEAQSDVKAEVKSAGASLKLTYFGEFGREAKKRPILKGFLNKGETSSLIGPPKSLKSGLMTEIAVYCAAGEDWRGHSATESCGVVIFALERADLYRRRLDAYAQRDGHKNLPVAVAGAVLDLLNPKCVQIIVATVREAEQHLGHAVGLIVIDTFSKGIAAGGGDEDKAKDQNRVAANLRRVHGLLDVHIACVGHTGKDEDRGARGSNAHLGDVDLMIQIRGEKTKTAKITDANDQPDRVVAQFRAEVVELGVDDDGEVETTSIVSNEDVSSPDTGDRKLSDNQQAALDQLWECIADGETAPRPNDNHVPPSAKGTTLAIWRKRLAAKGIINPEGNPHEQFKRIHMKLQKLQRIGVWEGFVWPVT